MSRNDLLDKLKEYKAFDRNEKLMQNRLLSFVHDHSDCYKRELLIGHVTASCWVMNKNKEEVLLIHHVKLDKWLQPGGHCDGNENVYEVAKKELEEETGLIPTSIDVSIYDLDIHTIPERKGIPEHEHFDIRFLFTVNKNQRLIHNHETKDMKWMLLKDVDKYTKEESVLRMRDKCFMKSL
jgi:8-oxo-dGTP pyrophosphatase MutT (NUDIX family)